MPLQATSGAASYDAFGGGVAAVPNYIEDVFSTYLYTGNGTTGVTISNGIDLSGKGGLVWTKARTGTGFSHELFDTARTSQYYLETNTTNPQSNYGSTAYFTFNANGFTDKQAPTESMASWTFRKQPKFFDVVTWTGNGVNDRAISHALGSTPGCIIIKRTDNANDWYVYHRSIASNYWLLLNSSAAQANAGFTWTTVSSTSFTVPSGAGFNASGGSYVAYVFAHDAGGFGLTGTDNVISCGSYTGTGATGNAITLGYEPQFVIVKRTDTTADWITMDAMRGGYLKPNTSDAELGGSGWFNVGGDNFFPTATGFQVNTAGAAWNASGGTYIYIAIRRGPMKVPTSGTSVFYPQTISQADTIDSTGVPFPPDLVNTFSRNGTDRGVSYNQFQFSDRLRGLGTPNNTLTASAPTLISSDTSVENTSSSYIQLKADSRNIVRGTGWNAAGYGNWIDYFWRRAPSVMDVVCYTGTGVNPTNFNHNLGAVPELMILKKRSNTDRWEVYSAALGNTKRIDLNTDGAATTVSIWGGTPTTTQFSLTDNANVNQSGQTYVAYLFATCAGVSKVGSYTGTGTTLQVNCGFTGGARFVLIKRTDSTGDWYVWDSARGIVSGNDPYLLLNSTAAEVTNTDYVDTYSAGFEISSTAPAAINASGGTFIFLAIA